MGRPPGSSRAAIVEHALALASERGPSGVRLRDVAQRAGIATGTVYNYFPDRDALLAAMVARAEAVVVEVMDDAAPAGSPLREAVPRLVDALLDLATGPRLLPEMLEVPRAPAAGAPAPGASVRAWVEARVRQAPGGAGPGDPALVAEIACAVVGSGLRYVHAHPAARGHAAGHLRGVLLALLPSGAP